jgi:hypothetical protein
MQMLQTAPTLAAAAASFAPPHPVQIYVHVATDQWPGAVRERLQLFHGEITEADLGVFLDVSKST